MRELLQGSLKRGKVELRAAIETRAGAACASPRPRCCSASTACRTPCAAWLPDARALSVADVLRLAPPSGQRRRATGARAGRRSPRKTLDDLVAAREREGARLAKMLLGHLTQLRELAEQALPLVPQLVEQQRTRFLERWKEAMGLAAAARCRKPRRTAP